MDFKELCCSIRSILNSSKGPQSSTQLMRDYHDMLGEAIPFRKFGHNSLESLLRAVPNLRISSIRGEIFAEAKPDEKTAHIANLVREQRCAKKKKRKPIRGFSRGGLPPPRRPATIPPPRRPAPPSREYYPSRRRDSPPRQSYQSQRRPSPPRRTERNEYYTRSKDPPSFKTYRNSVPIEISSDEDNGTNGCNGGQTQKVEEIRRKYCSQPDQYDISDTNDDNDDYASDLEDCDQINNQMEELKVTLGKDRQVSINKPKLRSYPSNTSNDDDIGYSSMKTGERTSKFYRRTISSDSHYDDDEENDSTTTSTGQFSLGGRYLSGSRGNLSRRPFNHCNRTEISAPVDFSTYTRSSRGRGSLLENNNRKPMSSSRGPRIPQKDQEGNIKVTVPNGSGRGRVVAFLLR